MTEVHLLEWRHPRHGRIREVVCLRHEGDVLRALKTLGIGSTGREFGDAPCRRCMAESEGVEARFYLGLVGS